MRIFLVIITSIFASLFSRIDDPAVEISTSNVFLLERIPNKTYVIKKPIKLENDVIIKIAPNSTIRFEKKGTIYGGILVFHNTSIQGKKGCFSNKTLLEGTINNDYFDFGWFETHEKQSATSQLQSALNVCQGTRATLYIPDGVYLLAPSTERSMDYKNVYCLKLSKSISIIGESEGNTILKTVTYDLSRPNSNAYDADGCYRYGSLFKVQLKEDSKIHFTNITFDGNSEGFFYQYDKRYLGHKCFYCVGTSPSCPSLIEFKAQNVTVKNFESEGFYNESYDIRSNYLVEDCQFINNAGSSGNLGGNTVYRNCLFDRANIEHCFNNGNPKWTKEKCIVQGCVFRDRSPVMCDIGRNSYTKSTSEIMGSQIIIDSCQFVKTASFLAFLPRKVQATALSVYEAENIQVSNCVFINAANNQGYGSSCINIRKNALNIVIQNNVFKCTAPNSVFRIMISKDSNIETFNSKANHIIRKKGITTINRDLGKYALNITESVVE